jgi:hypothetical protein
VVKHGPPGGVHEEAGWLSEHRYPPRWNTRHKPGGVGGILQGRSWHGDRRRERARPSLGATAFLSSRPDEESHEIALFANAVFAHIAFKVSSLAEFRSIHARVVAKNITIKFVFNHRASFAFYFDDPDGNMIEVYWPTGDLSCTQLYTEPLDLSQPDEALLEKITATP